MNLTSGCIAHLHELSFATDEKMSPFQLPCLCGRSSCEAFVFSNHCLTSRRCSQLNHHIGQESWRHGMPCVPLHIVPVQSSFLGKGHTVPRGAEGQVLQLARLSRLSMARKPACFLSTTEATEATATRRDSNRWSRVVTSAAQPASVREL